MKSLGSHTLTGEPQKSLGTYWCFNHKPLARESLPACDNYTVTLSYYQELIIRELTLATL